MEKKKVRAICLISGGLDSLLAACVLRDQGIEVLGLTFSTPFFGPTNAEKGCKQIGIPLRVIDISEPHLKMLKDPPHGYGKNMNPCIDCHAMMVRVAGELMKEEGFDLIATGEVLNERPMSQNMDSLNVVAHASGVEEYILRPLSAKLLMPTKPETLGLVDRDRLCAIEGRSRKMQMELAKKFGIKDYLQPAGGCLLTDPEFSIRLKGLLQENPDAGIREMYLLKHGRHFIIPSGARVIVGRNEKDNESIVEHAKGKGVIIMPAIIPGPTVHVSSEEKSDVEFACTICASFSNHKGCDVELTVVRSDSEEHVIVKPQDKNDFSKYRVGSRS